MALSDVINVALERIQYIAKTETIFGNPVNIGDVTLIPVSKVSIGFAAGGAGKEDKSGGSGAGTGGGVNVTPVAFISISSGGDIRVHHLEGSELIDLSQLLSLAPDTVKKIIRFVKKKFKGGGDGDDEDSEHEDITEAVNADEKSGKAK